MDNPAAGLAARGPLVEGSIESIDMRPGQDAAHADDTEPRDKMAIMIHSHGRNAVTRLDSKAFERLGQSTGVVRHTLPIRPVG